MQPTDWARLAAYIDGEGCISLTQSNRNLALRIVVANTSAPLMNWLRDNFRGHIHQMKARLNRRPCWIWTVSDRQAEMVLQNCLVYFIVKREQAELGLLYRKTVLRSGERRITPDTVVKERQVLREKLISLKKPA